MTIAAAGAHGAKHRDGKQCQVSSIADHVTLVSAGKALGIMPLGDRGDQGFTGMSSHQLHTLHERPFEANRFVYPVLSRRSRGISIGVNLNPDKVCNFDCIYCQVDRTRQSETRFVEIDALLAELDEMLDFVASGEIYRRPRSFATRRPSCGG